MELSISNRSKEPFAPLRLAAIIAAMVVFVLPSFAYTLPNSVEAADFANDMTSAVSEHSQTRTNQPRSRNRQKFPNNNDYTPFYVALSAGVSGFGSIWLGKAEGYPFLLDLEGAYYFKEMLGAGINVNTTISKIHVTDIGIVGRETLWFVCPAIYGRYFYEKFVFKAGAGIGFLKGTFNRDYHNNDYDYGIYKLTVGGFVSLSANYMITKNFAAGLKIRTNIGKMDNEAYNRNPTALGYTLGINYNF